MLNGAGTMWMLKVTAACLGNMFSPDFWGAMPQAFRQLRRGQPKNF